MNIQTFGYISIGVGICVGVYFFWALKRQLVTRKWIAGNGRILESRIQDNGSSLEPYVKYSYVVLGKTYISDYMSPNRFVVAHPAKESTIDKMIAPYPVGKSVTVYFNPQNPQEAVLKKYDAFFASLIIALVSLIFIGAGISMVSGK